MALSSKLDDDQSPFSLITLNLRRLGGFHIERLVDCPGIEFEAFDLPFFATHIDVPTTLSTQESDVAPVVLQENISSSMYNIVQLQQACHQTFGNADALKFEFLEEHGPDRKQCILTITRPNGHTRSFKSEAEFKRRIDAKSRVAELAAEMGAVDFILHGNKKTDKSLVLAPVDEEYEKHLAERMKQLEGATQTETAQPDEVKVDEMSRLILEHCVEWRAGRSTPRWVSYMDTKTRKLGCALVLELTTHCQRVHSVDAIYDSTKDAQSTCSQVAVDEGILEFIKFGNGQTEPATIPTLDPLQPPEQVPTSTARGNLNLQNFFEGLPKPFPEPLERGKTAAELNAPALLNAILQLGKGSKRVCQFFSITEEVARVRLFGCVLRVIGPGTCLTYVVEPLFVRKGEAKAAVCFQALSQGFGTYMRNIAFHLENKVTAEMKRKVTDLILPILVSECSRLRTGCHPLYHFSCDEGAFGCTMTLSLNPKSEGGETKTWSVPTEFKAKADAKMALAYQAGEEAIIFVRFRGQPPPPGHEPLKPFKREDESKKGAVKAERKSPELNTDAPKSPTPAARQSPVSGKVKLSNSTSSNPSSNNKQDLAPRQQRAKTQKGRNPSSSQFGGTNAYHRQPTPAPTTSSAQYHYSAGTMAVQGPSSPSPPGYAYPGYYATPQQYTTGLPPPPPPGYDHQYTQPAVYFPPPQPSPVAPPHHPYPNGYAWSDPWYPYPQPPPPPPPPPSQPVYAYYAPPYAAPTPPPYPYPYTPVHASPPGPIPQVIPAIRQEVSPPPPPIQTKKPRKKPLEEGLPVHSEHTGETKGRGQLKRLRSPQEETNGVDGKSKRSKSEVSSSSVDVSSEREGVNVVTLLDYCFAQGIARPEFFHEPAPATNGINEFKVWVILGKERLELPTTFPDLAEGKERLAKQVLKRVRANKKDATV